MILKLYVAIIFNNDFLLSKAFWRIQTICNSARSIIKSIISTKKYFKLFVAAHSVIQTEKGGNQWQSKPAA